MAAAVAARTVGRWLAVLLLAAALGGCAATPQTRGLTAEPPSRLPPRAELERVPFFAQERYQCGPAALAMLLNDQGHDIAPDELVDEVYVPARQGSLRPEMRAAMRARGLVAYPLTPELEAVLTEIAAGRPVLVMQNLGLSWYPRWHYAVAVGYDLPAGEIVLRSGTIRRRVTELANFERTWARSGHWAQVVVPPDRIPASAEPLPWLTAVRELEATGQTAAARRGYRSATRQWPDEGAAWMARGNAAYEAEASAEARDAFAEAVRLQPRAADHWNNYAYALAADGCRSAAVDAARCAVALSDGAEPARATLDEIRAGGTGSGRSCSIPACPVDSAEIPGDETP